MKTRKSLKRDNETAREGRLNAEGEAWAKERGGADFPAVEPWPEAVEGKALLEELEQVVRRFVVLPKWAPETLALWVLHTYAFELRDVSTYLGVESPQKRCGKTTLLTVLGELVNRPVVASNISSPAFFRVIQQTRPTLLIDEADSFLQANEELRGILNSGYTRKTAFVWRVVSEVRSGECGIRNPECGAGRAAWGVWSAGGGRSVGRAGRGRRNFRAGVRRWWR